MRGPQRFVVRIGEREHEVEVAGDGRVRVDGEAESHEVVEGPLGRALIRGPDGAQIRVTLSPEARAREASLGGLRVALELLRESEATLARARGPAVGGPGDGRLRAPMPGRVVKVLLKAGERVEAGTPALVVEAMKMENELACPCAGVVEFVTVSAGDTVESGQELLRVVD